MDLKADEYAGEVTQIHGNNNYRVDIDVAGNLREILCYLSGNMTRFRIKVVVGDKVTVKCIDPFDRGRITYRDRG